MGCASRTLNQYYGSCTELLSLGIFLWRRLASTSMIDKFCLKPYNFHMHNLPVEENNPRRQLLQVSKCLLVCGNEYLDLRQWKNRVSNVSGCNRWGQTCWDWQCLFGSRFSPRGGLHWKDGKRDPSEWPGWITIGHQRVINEFCSGWAMLYQVWVPRCCQGCCRHLCDKQPRLPFAGHSPFQMDPMAPPQALAEPCSQGGGASEIMCVRKCKMLPGSEGWGKIWVKQLWESWGVSSRRGGGAPRVPAETPVLRENPGDGGWPPAAHGGAEIHIAAQGGSHAAAVWSWRNCSACEGPQLEQFMKICSSWRRPRLGAAMRRKEQWRGAVTDWPQTPFPIPYTAWWGGGKGVRGDSKPGKKGEVRWRWFYFCLCFSTSYSILNWQ